MAKPHISSGEAPLSDRSSGSLPVSPRQESATSSPPSRSLTEALRAAGMTLDGPMVRAGSETPSEEDYDESVRLAMGDSSNLRHRHGRSPHLRAELFPLPDTGIRDIVSANGVATEHRHHPRHDFGIHVVPDEDNSLQQLLRASSQRARDATPQGRRRKFADLVFTRQFSAFDRKNMSAVNSPFHGFYTLFWLAVTLFVFKISADNWRTYGNLFGTSDIMKTMFSRDGKFVYHAWQN